MFEKISRAWKIAKMCWRVLMLDKELVVFPLLTIATCGILVVAAFGSTFAVGQFEAVFELLRPMNEDGSINFVSIAIDFAVYFVAYFVIIFFNAALIACAKIRFAGGDPTVMDGLKASVARLPQIFSWALVTSIVGFILQKAANNSDSMLGKIIFGLIGAAWAIASFFVVPIIVSEKLGPIDALKRSASVIRKTWGELIVAEVGMAVLVTLIVFPAFLMGFVGMFTLEFAPLLFIPIIVLVVAWVFLASLVYSTLSSILRAALYVYATDGKIPEYFDEDVIRNPVG